MRHVGASSHVSWRRCWRSACDFCRVEADPSCWLVAAKRARDTRPNLSFGSYSSFCHHIAFQLLRASANRGARRTAIRRLPTCF
jgi:hypothetical protein